MFQLLRFSLVVCYVLSAVVLGVWSLPKNSPSDGAASLPTAQPAAAGGRAATDASVAEDFVRASQHCMQQQSLDADLRRQVNALQYADVPAVHRYLHCVWSRMDLWTDRSGFEVDRIADLYRTRANAELLVPTLINCNGNVQAAAPARWCYLATQCILDSPVGQWFRDDVARVKTLPNGH